MRLYTPKRGTTYKVYAFTDTWGVIKRFSGENSEQEAKALVEGLKALGLPSFTDGPW